MIKKLSDKKVFKSILSLLLITTIILSFLLPISVYATDTVFTGVTDSEVLEYQEFDLMEGVSAFNDSGEELQITVNEIICSTGEPQETSDIINVGPAGTSYTVEYSASSSSDSTEVYTAHRNIVSIQGEDSNSESESDASGESSEGEISGNTPDTEVHEPDSDQDEDVSSGDDTITEESLPEVSAPHDSEKDESSKPNSNASRSGLPIIFKNGLHYIDDPEYPDERIILYCMNNKLKWPHSTSSNPHVPNYEEGYLTPEHFQSVEDYNDCIQKMRKLLFAGYPYNGERLYKIVDDGAIHKPTVHEFNEMLIVPPQLETAFPYLGHHEFTLADLNNKKHFEELVTFIGDVSKLAPNNTTSNGLTYLDIVSMPFYKAANSLTFSGMPTPGHEVTEDDVLTAFGNLHSHSYFVTETQAYDSTQLAIWYLMNQYNIESNNINSFGNDELAPVLWQYCQHGDVLREEPTSNQLEVEGDLQFKYHPSDNKWHSGFLEVIEPLEYNGLYNLELPEGVTAICENLTYVYGNEQYELVSDYQPKFGDKFTIRSGIDWMKDMKQYSPIGDKNFQHMVGAIIRKTEVSKSIYYNSIPEGSLRISKTVVGKNNDPDREFNFILQLSDKSLNGLYGDLEFNKGISEFTLKAGESKIATHLPAKAKYRIIEKDNDGYKVSSVNAAGAIIRNAKIRVTFTNTKINDLIIGKIVQGEMGDKTKPFTFNIEIMGDDGKPFHGSYDYTGSVKPGYENESKAPADGTLTFRNGSAQISLSHGQQIIIKGIPGTYTYKVTEEEANTDGYTTTYNKGSSPASGTMETNAEVEVINMKEYIPDTGINDPGHTGFTAGVILASSVLLLTAAYELFRRRRKQKNGR